MTAGKVTTRLRALDSRLMWSYAATKTIYPKKYDANVVGNGFEPTYV